MFSFYCNRNCVNVHWEMQSNTARLNFLLPRHSWPISDGLFSNIQREVFLSCVFLWIFSAVWNPKFLNVNGYRRAHSSGPDFPIRLRFTRHFNVWKMSKKDWITSLLLDPTPMLPKKSGFCCLKKSLATRKPTKNCKKKIIEERTVYSTR